MERKRTDEMEEKTKQDEYKDKENNLRNMNLLKPILCVDWAADYI